MKTQHQRNLSWPRAVRAGFALLCVIGGFAPCGHARSHDSRSRPAPEPITSQFAIADFDGDSRPDIATVEVGQSNALATRYLIAFRLSTGLQQTVGIAAPTGGLQLTSRDVNGDSFPDVVVTTFWTDQPVAVLLNDGHGNFTQSEPYAFPGAFEESESSLTFRTDTIADDAALVFSHFLPGQCEERRWIASPANVIERSPVGNFHFVALPFSDSSFGRAPPSVAFHS